MLSALRWFSVLTFLTAGCSSGGTPPPPPPRDGGMVVSRDGGPGTCPAGRTNCGGLCVDTTTNPAHCGGCGMPCTVSETCRAGDCVPATTCPPGQDDCGMGCVDTGSSDQHCGRCGNPCDAGEVCMDGACEPAACPPGRTRCGTSCTDTTSDAANCGTCGRACTAEQMCTDGACVSVCAAGETPCTIMDEGTTRVVCVNTGTSSAHCGACNRACPAGQSCTAGGCVCPTGTTDCDGACVSTDTDPANCGDCDVVCPSGQSCTAGACTCPGGLTACGAACVNTAVDNMNCGACGRTCSTPAQTCVGGSCMAACGGGSVLCGGSCANLMTDNMHCGACGNACASGTSCAAGVCRPSNDVRSSAIAVTLPTDRSEATIMGSTVGATRDGPTISGCAANGPNVWYRVVLPTRGVLWADTAGSSYDTAIFITDMAGAAVSVTGGTTTNPGLCNDDCCRGTGEFTSGLQSCAGGSLAAGTYYISVGGFSESSTGAFTLHVQFIPDTGYLYGSRLAGVGTTSSTVLVGTSEAADMCAGGFSSRSGEDMRWFVSCGVGSSPQTLSLCPADGGTYSRASGSSIYDPVLYVWSGKTGREVACNDDGPSTLNCRGTGGDSANFGPRLAGFEIPRGIGAVFIDSRGAGGSGMTYSMRHDVPTIP